MRDAPLKPIFFRLSEVHRAISFHPRLKHSYLFRRVSFLLAVLSSTLIHNQVFAAETALDRYVHAPDAAYNYKAVTNIVQGEVKLHVLDMTSQRWLTTNEVNRTEWRHWLMVYEPQNARPGAALLFISGGNNKSQNLPNPDKRWIEMAKATKSVVVELRMVPNQPLIFHGDGKERVEDDLIAYGWDKFLRGGPEEWLARLPMTKSAVRAMDTITDYLGKPEQGGLKIDKFVVAGASKRGWTTWTTAITDKRVIAIAPIVIDMLNVVPSFRHHWEAYGFYAPSVGDYVSHGIMDWQDTPEYARLLKIEEPYEYRDRLTLPKLLINAVGDQFFLPDSHRFYFDDLKGPKFLRYIPNTDHSLRDSDVTETLAAWLYTITEAKPLPRFDWKVDWKKGSIEVQAKDRPSKILLWQATNPEARDFRLEKVGKIWTSSEITLDADGKLVAQVEKPEKGWTAFVVEMSYKVEGFPAPLKLTTGVAVVPDVLPFAGKMPKTSPKR